MRPGAVACPGRRSAGLRLELLPRPAAHGAPWKHPCAPRSPLPPGERRVPSESGWLCGSRVTQKLPAPGGGRAPKAPAGTPESAGAKARRGQGEARPQRDPGQAAGVRVGTADPAPAAPAAAVRAGFKAWRPGGRAPCASRRRDGAWHPGSCPPPSPGPRRGRTPRNRTYPLPAPQQLQSPPPSSPTSGRSLNRTCHHFLWWLSTEPAVGRPPQQARLVSGSRGPQTLGRAGLGGRAGKGRRNWWQGQPRPRPWGTGRASRSPTLRRSGRNRARGLKGQFRALSVGLCPGLRAVLPRAKTALLGMRSGSRGALCAHLRILSLAPTALQRWGPLCPLAGDG